MSITQEIELLGIQAVSRAVGLTLREMRNHARPGMSSRELDEFGGEVLASLGARSAPKLTYGFPGFTCISINHEIAHGIPSAEKIIREGDLVNIDVSAELGGYYADNGGSFVMGEDIHGYKPLVDASREILKGAIEKIHAGFKISALGFFIQTEAKKRGFRVIKNLAGHGVGRSLHEDPSNILNYKDRLQRARFKKNSVVAVETFISTRSDKAVEMPDGWTLVGNKGGFVAQHEHTLIVGKEEANILTLENEIWSS